MKRLNAHVRVFLIANKAAPPPPPQESQAVRGAYFLYFDGWWCFVLIFWIDRWWALFSNSSSLPPSVLRENSVLFIGIRAGKRVLCTYFLMEFVLIR